VAVAGPVGHSVRRLDTLALLHWTLPELARLVPELPQRLTIISAGDPMWRGGLSAPQSLFLHAERPLISENATSTLLHELMHMSLRIRARDGYDWIVEGFAEYYSLQLLHRSGTISDERYAVAVADLAEWAAQADTLCGPESSGATTALAVGVLALLDDEISTQSAAEFSLDNVAHELARIEEPVDVDMLAELVEEIVGVKPDTLHIAELPGCRSMTAASRAP
jgi:predicted metalloprotease with PDZ domain